MIHRRIDYKIAELIYSLVYFSSGYQNATNLFHKTPQLPNPDHQSAVIVIKRKSGYLLIKIHPSVHVLDPLISTPLIPPHELQLPLVPSARARCLLLIQKLLIIDSMNYAPRSHKRRRGEMEIKIKAVKSLCSTLIHHRKVQRHKSPLA